MKEYKYKRVWMYALSLMIAALVTVLACEAALAGEGKVNVVDPETQSLNLPSIPNARQIGGYVTEDGRTVRQNVLLRTGWLTEASDEDIAALSDVYHVTTIVDFRGAMELTRTPDREVPGVEYVNISMEDKDKEAGAMASLAEMAQIEMQYADQPGRAMIEMIRLGWRAPDPDMYITMITSEATVPAYRAFFDLLLTQDENSVVLYHCKGGKDRTGIATMYILTLLGVDKETILEDFDMTNIFLADEINAEVEKSRPYAENEEELDDVAINNGVSRDFLANAFDYAEEEYGSMLELIKQRYGVTDEEIETLRNLYLTD